MNTLKSILAVAVFAVVPAAQALVILPDSGVFGVSRWTGTQTSQSEINTVIAPIISPSVELYKHDYGNALPSGVLDDSYETVFSGSGPNHATLTYQGGDIVGGNPFLLVKDGKGPPAWYLFDLGAFGWNGTETLELKNFWLDISGAISHVTLYGTRTTQVPESAATILLMGLGILIVGVMARRKN